jgi:hypothetical protein
MQVTRMNPVFAVIAIAAVSLLALSHSGAATNTSTAPARHYYLTKTLVSGNQALNACASGYHFASYAEVIDPAVLSYNKTLGVSAADDGSGPPSYSAGGVGWIRTGFSSNSQPSTNTPTNCSLWTSDNSSDFGEVAIYDPSAGNGSAAPVVVFGNNAACNLSLSVWCVEN